MQLASNLLAILVIVIGSITVLANGIFKVTLLTSKTTLVFIFLCFSNFNPMVWYFVRNKDLVWKFGISSSFPLLYM